MGGFHEIWGIGRRWTREKFT